MLMAVKDYQRSFTTQRTPEEVFAVISNVKSWWTRDTEGSAAVVGDEFTIHFGKLWKTMRVIDARPGAHIAWEVVDCHMPFLKNVKEWKGTIMRFDIASGKAGARVTLTHVGLTPDIECYGACEKGWAYFFGECLPNVLGKRTPHTRERKS